MIGSALKQVSERVMAREGTGQQTNACLLDAITHVLKLGKIIWENHLCQQCTSMQLDFDASMWGDRCMTGGSNNSRPQVGEDHLEEEHAHAVHVKLVWVIQAPQDGGQEGSHGQWRRSRSLHTYTQDTMVITMIQAPTTVVTVL